jgi:hypothetical protein
MHPEDYFAEHPEEEDDFIDALAELYDDTEIEYPEEWPEAAWLEGA